MNTHTERKGGKAGRPARRLCAALLCLCLLAGLAPNIGTTAYAAGTAIGETVEFAGHEWYIIGTPTEGVTAPSGCYTLFAKNNDFGFTVFRPISAPEDEQSEYSGSRLQEKMAEIAEGFSEEERSNIQPRTLTAASDNIAGDTVENQHLWPISAEEGNKLDQSIRSFSANYYWTRQSDPYGSAYVHIFSSEGTLSGSVCYNTYAIRPALYVKQEANAIRNAQMGVNFEQSTGTDTPLVIDESLKLDVRMEASQINKREGALDFRIFGDTTTTGPNRVVAAVLTDENGNVKYYGKFRDCSGKLPEKSDFSISMGEVTAGTYTLSIFLHDTETNQISELSPTMKVEIGGTIGTITEYNGQTYEKDLAFTQHPQNQIVYTGSTATFSAEAEGIEGINIEYTWQAQPKSSDPETGIWYEIEQLSGVVALPYNSKTLEFTNPSGTWSDNSYYVVSGFLLRSG